MGRRDRMDIVMKAGPDTRSSTYREGGEQRFWGYVDEVRRDKGRKCLEETTREWPVHRRQSRLGCRGTW